MRGPGLARDARRWAELPQTTALPSKCVRGTSVVEVAGGEDLPAAMDTPEYPSPHWEYSD